MRRPVHLDSDLALGIGNVDRQQLLLERCDATADFLRGQVLHRDAVLLHAVEAHARQSVFHAALQTRRVQVQSILQQVLRQSRHLVIRRFPTFGEVGWQLQPRHSLAFQIHNDLQVENTDDGARLDALRLMDLLQIFGIRILADSHQTHVDHLDESWWVLTLHGTGPGDIGQFLRLEMAEHILCCHFASLLISDVRADGGGNLLQQSLRHLLVEQ
mmetsp:Transcript_18443/g.51239  ORF Transcript_18443/g.51239 Transcript_18443/m.51239 type:complete len:215 (+) Transcript_18443:422-1066(+)